MNCISYVSERNRTITVSRNDLYSAISKHEVMHSVSRRSFIKCSGGLFMFTLADFDGIGMAKKSRLSFSTLGCPDWSLDQILDYASAHGYSGVEIRGIQRQLDLSQSPHFNTPAAIRETKKKFKKKNIDIVGLGASAAMHHAAQTERNKAFEESKKFIDLAQQTGCPYVRVFPDKLPADQDRLATLSRITEGLDTLGEYAKGRNVTVLMETHGDVVKVADLERVMNGVKSDNVGLVWDIANMWMVTREPPAEVYPRLRKWIRHTHLKDLKLVNGKHEYTLFGEGEVPAFDALDLLIKDNYKGYYSFEWEKLWHPEIADPELAFEHFAKTMNRYLNEGNKPQA